MLKSRHAWLTVLIIIFIDQAFKIWIKTNLEIGDSIKVFGEWFKLHFVENPGMAFGLKFGGIWGKYALTLFRIAAVVAIGYYISNLIRKRASKLQIVCISMIFAGALGNIIDSTFYGVLFDKGTIYNAQLDRWMSYEGIAEMNFGMYSSPFKGCVVDMLYFPMIKGHIPSWSPIWKGEFFMFFRPVFNIADSSITIGVIIWLLFNKSFTRKLESSKLAQEVTTSKQE